MLYSVEVIPASLPTWSMWEATVTQHTVSLRETLSNCLISPRPQSGLIPGHAGENGGLCPWMSCAGTFLDKQLRKVGVVLQCL